MSHVGAMLFDADTSHDDDDFDVGPWIVIAQVDDQCLTLSSYDNDLSWCPSRVIDRYVYKISGSEVYFSPPKGVQSSMRRVPR